MFNDPIPRHTPAASVDSNFARAETLLKAQFSNFYVEKISMSQNRYKNFVTSEFLRMRRLRVGHFPQHLGLRRKKFF